MVAAGVVAGVAYRRRLKKRNFLERLKLPLQPSLKQVIGVLHRVDPALGNLAETVSEVWGVLQTELAERRELGDLGDASEASPRRSVARTGTLLLHLFAVGRLKLSQGAGFNLPATSVPLISDLALLSEAQTLTKFAVASYGANVLALVGLLQFRDAWPPAGLDRDKAAAARYLQQQVPTKTSVLACGTKMPRRQEEDTNKLDSFKPWWVLLEHQDELVLSIRGSANIDDIATDLACSTCEFLHGYAHEGMALAVQAVWEEAAAEVQKAIHGRDYRRFVVCGHSLGGSVSLLLGMKLRAESSLPLEVHAFAAGPAPAFQGESQELEKGLISVINRFDPVPHLSLDAALRMVLAAERLEEAGLSWQQTLSLVVGTSEVSSPKFEELMADIPQTKAPLRIPGEAIWLVDAMAGRQILAVDLCDVENLQRFSQELPEISVAQSALDHVMSTYVYNMDKAVRRLEGTE